MTKTRKVLTTAPRLIRSKNESWGYHGTAQRNGNLSDDQTAREYHLMARAIISEYDIHEAQAIEFLDSRAGRMLADETVSPGRSSTKVPHWVGAELVALGYRPVAEDTIDAILAPIAKKCLGLETLQSRGSDRMDFSEHGVLAIRDALRAAYEAGRAAK